MLGPYVMYLDADLLDVSLRLLDRGHTIALPLPPLNVRLHLADAAVLLLYLVAELALARLVDCVVDQLQAARLARPVLLVTLLAEAPPLPVAAGPAGLVEVTHEGESPAPFRALPRSGSCSCRPRAAIGQAPLFRELEPIGDPGWQKQRV